MEKKRDGSIFSMTPAEIIEAFTIEDETSTPPTLLRVYWHGHPLKRQDTHEDKTWICDATKYFGKCLEGIDEGEKSVGHDRWRDEASDFDLCESCVKLSLKVQRLMLEEDSHKMRIHDVIVTYHQFYKDIYAN